MLIILKTKILNKSFSYYVILIAHFFMLFLSKQIGDKFILRVRISDTSAARIVCTLNTSYSRYQTKRLHALGLILFFHKHACMCCCKDTKQVSFYVQLLNCVNICVYFFLQPILEAQGIVVWLDKNYRSVRIPADVRSKIVQFNHHDNLI